MRKHHIIYWTIYIVTCGWFGWHTLTKHIPAVGWDYVYEHWLVYVLMWIGGTAFWALFYSFGTLILVIDEATKIDRSN